MLIGEYKHRIDSKKRLSIPFKYRKEIGESVIITRGLDTCLFVYSQEEWSKIISKLEQLPLNQSRARNFSRMLLAGAFEAQIDSLGRVIIPDYLKNYAELKNEVFVIGVHSRLEIWSIENWERYKKESEKKFTEIAEQLQNF